MIPAQKLRAGIFLIRKMRPRLSLGFTVGRRTLERRSHAKG
jgi:hypothetical protein